MSVEATEIALEQRLITVAEALEQTGTRSVRDLHERAAHERRRARRAA